MQKLHRIGALLALLLSLTLLVACSDAVTLSYKDGTFRDRGGKHTYSPAPMNYEPTAQGEAYAVYKSSKSETVFYRIGDEDPTLWLTEDYVGGMTTVLYASSIDLPTLADFGAEKVLLCVSDQLTVVLQEITDTSLIDALVSAFTTGEVCEWPAFDLTCSYDLKFYSPAWSAICMNLTYGETAEGQFLFERASGRCVAIEPLLDGILGADA